VKALQRFAYLVVARMIYSLFATIAAMVGADMSADDLGAASAAAAGIVALALCAGLELAWPKFWKWIKARKDGDGVPMLAGVVLAMGLLVAAPGCSLFATPPTPVTEQDRMLAEVGRWHLRYQVAVAIIAERHRRGDISDTDMRQIYLPLEQTMFEILEAATAAAEAGDRVTVAQQSKLLADAIARFSNAQGPTTRPE
jgi:ABC-type transport system involved in cytochrome c biogenesis permease subunit